MLAVAERPPATPPAPGRPRWRLTALLVVVAVVVAAAVVEHLLTAPPRPTAPGPYSAWVAWPAVKGAVTARIELNGHLIDRVPAGGARRYQLRGLWPATSFRVGITLSSAGGRRLARYHRVIRTTRATRPFPRLYSSTAFINQPIPNSPPVASNSARMVAASFQSQASRANLSNNADWGIPIVYGEAHTESTTVGCTTYLCWLHPGPVRIPAGARPNTGSDHHLVVLGPGGTELDMWLARHTGATWTAGERWLESSRGPAANCRPGLACGGANAAYFALGAGVVRPEEIAQGHIDHALAITTPITREGYVACPAGHGDGRHDDINAVPIGAHLQLDPAVDVDGLPIPRWERVIAVALQRYGAYVVDTGGSVAIYAQSDLGRGYNAWHKAGVPSDSPHLSDLPWSSMRVLAMTRCAR